MRWMPPLVLVSLLPFAGSCRGRIAAPHDAGVDDDVDGGVAQTLVVGDVSPTVIDSAGGSTVVVNAAAPGARVLVGGVEATVVSSTPTTLRVRTPPLPAGGAILEVEQAGLRVASPTALQVFSPTMIDGARVFDAAFGVEVDDVEVTRFSWQRLTAVIDPAWRVRDGNTLTWLPSQQRFFMVAGWNGYQAPEGFSTIDPAAYPPENTTTEIWSSSDGASWRLDRPHGDAQFERRHAHNTMLWHDALWMIGGDYHQGKENHDVVTSSDGVHWRTVLGPGAASDPPWSRRVLQMSGVFAGKLWTAGGQSVTANLDDVVYHNDVWSTDDGEHWTQVAADAPASGTRWAGCGVVDGLVEFHDELWVVGCARERADAVGHAMSNEVWSTSDGVSWRRHADPPWTGKIWSNVVVWQQRLWVLFGYTYGDAAHGLPPGNANEVWFSDDGETWDHLPFDLPAPGSHAQGIAVTDDALVYAGGNYSFGFGAGEDKSAWRLVPVHGAPVTTWNDRGRLGFAARVPVADPTGATAPLLVREAFAGGAGVVFDGSRDLLALVDEAGIDVVDARIDSDGFTVFAAVRSPVSPAPFEWPELYNPASTIVGNVWPPRSALGLHNGSAHYMSRRDDVDADGSLQWDVVPLSARTDLQGERSGALHTIAVVHSRDGRVVGIVDGVVHGGEVSDFGSEPGWSRLGGGVDGATEGTANRFAGAIGAVVVVHRALATDDMQRLHQWALGRFGSAEAGR
jgi:hypothetical protein